MIRATLFGWLPAWYRTEPELLAYSTGVQVATVALWLVSAVLVGPVVEEIYFRGWLLPRLSGGPVVASTCSCSSVWPPV